MLKNCLSKTDWNNYVKSHKNDRMEKITVKFDFRAKKNRKNNISNINNNIYFIENQDSSTTIVFPNFCREYVENELFVASMEDEYFLWIE